ncbi:MAG: PAS domain-containing protein [Candidatus Hydrogenedentes bacterium]|nr:PAS domain-containing protein [Candidatus Hydrogenedentota bacterium]
MDSALYQQIIDSLTSGVLALDKDRCLVTANPAAAQHLGLPREDFLAGECIAGNPALTFLDDLVAEMIQTGEPVFRREIEWTFEGDKTKVIGVTASLLKGPEAFNGAIFLFADLTEVRALARVADLNKQLAHVGELTAGVVHELRNPLSVISGEAELLQRKVKEEPALLRHVKAIQQEVRGLDQLVNQFLVFARPFSLHKAAAFPEDIVKRGCLLCERQAGAQDVRLMPDAPDGLGQVHVDAGKLAQALSNLIANAVEVSPPGAEVRVQVQLEEEDLLLVVEDSGPGIQLAPGEDVFSPFFSRKEGGTGLGLSIVHRIADAHGGSVTHSNLQQGGARFELRVPRT